MAKNLSGEAKHIVEARGRKGELPGNADNGADEDVLPMDAAQFFGRANQVVKLGIDHP